MTNKEKYRQFCQKEKDIPIFNKDWWLDSVCGKDNWDVVLVEKGQEIFASFTYYKKKKVIYEVIAMPQLTQTMGVYIKYPEKQKNDKKLSYEKDIMGKLIELLPDYDIFNQNFHYSITNWLPFYWNGFNETTKYTYLIQDIHDIDTAWNNFSSSARSKINKAKKNLMIQESNDIKLFYEINKMSFDRQNISMPYSFEFIQNLDFYCKKNNSRKILFAKDTDNNIHVAIYLVWDNRSVYLIMSGGNPKLRNSGAKNLLVYEGIKFAIENNLIFDFEGSMMENIEIYNRSFGAKQTAYFNISKTNSKFLKIRKLIKEIVK
jgi:hypothetical protein